jgi:hypothetical protein
MPKKVESLRDIAAVIIVMRKALIRGTVSTLGDRPTKKIMTTYANAQDRLPVSVLAMGGLEKRVIEPCTRKIMREGILAQQ